MSTEAELVLSSLTKDELVQAFDFARFLEETYGREETRHLVPGHVIDHRVQRMVLDTVCLALLREVDARMGSVGWFLGEPLDDHPQGWLLAHYQERLALNPDLHLKRRTVEPGERRSRTCESCHRRLSLLPVYWATTDDGIPTGICRSCVGPMEAAIAMETEMAASAAVPDVAETLDWS